MSLDISTLWLGHCTHDSDVASLNLASEEFGAAYLFDFFNICHLFIGHDNTDISIATIDLLQELTDVDTLTESQEGATALVDALVSVHWLGYC